jgi:hypothetical protein
MATGPHEEIFSRLRAFQKENRISAFSLSETGEKKDLRIWLSWVGEGPERDLELKEFIANNHISKEDQAPLRESFYFFASGYSASADSASNFNELRPGSGLIRVFGGKSEGPGGTVTCLLNPQGGTDIYFAAAGHVLTDFWQDRDKSGSIYRYRKGFPPSGSTRFLGKVLYSTPEPESERNPQAVQPVYRDVGIVKLADERAETRQRTTCYGTFGELPPRRFVKVDRGTHVVKCGSQETHWTEAVVEVPNQTVVTIFGPKLKSYTLHNQIILRDLTCCEARNAECPKNALETPFAVPGDSGTMVVEKRTKRPVGMLIAGSVLDGRYVVTPFSAIQKFFDSKRLVMQRA